jgi:hypothetical protein
VLANGRFKENAERNECFILRGRSRLTLTFYQINERKWLCRDRVLMSQTTEYLGVAVSQRYREQKQGEG